MKRIPDIIIEPKTNKHKKEKNKHRTLKITHKGMSMII